MNSNKGFIGLIIFLIFILTSCSISHYNNLPESISTIRLSVIQIGVSDKPLGSGFLINSQGYAITANHVINDCVNIQKRLKGQLIAKLATPYIEEGNSKYYANFEKYNFEIIDRNQIHDLAIIKIVPNPFTSGSRKLPFFKSDHKEYYFEPKPAKLDKGRPLDGSNIGVSGYPFGAPVLMTNSGVVATTWGFSLSRFENNKIISDDEYYFADLTINPGNSGGPVYLVNNSSVIGIAIGNLLDNVTAVDKGERKPIVNKEGHPLQYSSRLAKIIPIAFAIELLRKNNLNWEER